MKKLLAVVLAVVMLATTGGVVLAFDNWKTVGHDGLNGPHFNLNIIGVEDKMNDMDANNDNGRGHRIFVKLYGNSKIWLAEGDDFAVLDANGTDGDGAKFQLPDPSEGASENCTAYSVYVRALGNQGGTATMTTCAWDPVAEEEVCSSEVVELNPNVRPGKFTNVSKELLTICADLDGDSDYARYYLFDEALEDYFWSYNNNNMKIAQLRFYAKETCYGPDWECKGKD